MNQIHWILKSLNNSKITTQLSHISTSNLIGVVAKLLAGEGMVLAGVFAGVFVGTINSWAGVGSGL